jgi:hypothetical protein
MEANPAIAEAWRNRPAQFTSHPEEPWPIERMRACDLSALYC